MNDPIPLHSALDLLTRVRDGAVDTHTLAEAVHGKIQESAALNCVTPASAGLLYRRAENAGDGPLAGLPIAVKDSFDTSDEETTAGTPALASCRPVADAPVLTRLKAAGCFVAAKNTLHELSFGITNNNAWTGPACNPVDPSLIPGGSSGGTAVAVAVGIAPVGLAADTGGSARIPAALCGVAGFRPTAGRYPGGGAVPISHTRDTPGLIAHHVADLALVDAVLAGEPTDSTPPERELPGVRLGIPQQFWADLDPGVAQVCGRARDTLAEHGVQFVEVDLAPLLELLEGIALPLCLYEFPRDLRSYLEANRYPVTVDDVCDAVASPDVRKVVELARTGQAVSDAQYAEVLRLRAELRRRYTSLFDTERVEALFFPTTPLPARPIGQDETVELNGRQVPTFATFIRNADLAGSAGCPGVSVPAGRAEGLPVGVELDGRIGADRDLLALTAVVSRALRPATAQP